MLRIKEQGDIKWLKHRTTEGNGFIYGVDILGNNEIAVSGHFANSILNENGLY